LIFSTVFIMLMLKYKVILKIMMQNNKFNLIIQLTM